MSSLLDMLVSEAMESDITEYEYDYAEEAAVSAFDDGSIVDPTDDVLYTIAAIESYISDLDFEMAMEAAMESEGADGGESPETKKAKGLGNRIRAAFARLRGAKTPSEVEDARMRSMMLPANCKLLSTALKPRKRRRSSRLLPRLVWLPAVSPLP